MRVRTNHFFKHEVSAFSDEKLLLLVQEEGLRGYGAYWMLLEFLRCQPRYRAPLQCLAALCCRGRTKTGYLRHIVGDFDLFVIEDGMFFSRGLCRRMEAYERRMRLGYAEDDPVLKSVKLEGKLLTLSKEGDVNARKEEEKIINNINNNRIVVDAGLKTSNQTGEPDTGSLPAAIRPWEKLVDEMGKDQEWMSVTGLHSGLRELFMNHHPEVLAVFKEHVRSRDNGGVLLTQHDVRQYFANCFNQGTRISGIMRERLQKAVSGKGSAGRCNPFETIVDGRRTYIGHAIPDHAPPRPDACAVWDDVTERWVR